MPPPAAKTKTGTKIPAAILPPFPSDDYSTMMTVSLLVLLVVLVVFMIIGLSQY
jgi:hypothetical protein